MNQGVYRDVLNDGYLLHWYEIKSVLGRGAFGVTYLAHDNNLDQLVAIKEYFPNDFSTRDSGYTVHPSTGESKELYEWGLDRFIHEARILAKFKHHNIVRVMSVFELNNTAYMVMEYEQGQDLSKLYKKKVNLSEQQLLNIFIPILDGLNLVHSAGFIHRDIKPANIYIRDDGSPVLIDFGAARKTIGTPTRAITSLVTHGYAPFEQYNESGDKQGAWTDIYALGACLYSAVKGKLPIDALDRGSSLLADGKDPFELISETHVNHYSLNFLRAIDNALIFNTKDRPQKVLVWGDMLNGKVKAPLLTKHLYKTPNGADDATVIRSQRPSGRQFYQSTREVSNTQQQITMQVGGAEFSASRWKVLSVTLILFVLVAAGGSVGAYFWNNSRPDQPVESTIQMNKQVLALLEKADLARRAGVLLEKEVGAIYLYLKVLNAEPNNQEANNKIAGIIELYAGVIRNDLAEGLNDKALRNLQQLKVAIPGSTVVLELNNEMQVVNANNKLIIELLNNAKVDFKAGRITRPKKTNALMTYRRVLSMEPENVEAKQGIKEVLSYFYSRLENNLKNKNVLQLESNINNVLSIEPNSEVVSKFRVQLVKIKQQHKKSLQLLAAARRAFKSGDIISPVNKSALTFYRRVLKIDKNNGKAKQGIKNIVRQLRQRFKKHMDGNDRLLAKSLLIKIEKTMPQSWLAKTTRKDWEQGKAKPRPDIEIISEMVGQFKKRFESRDINALQKISQYKAGRKGFLHQFLKNYTSFKLTFSDIKMTVRDRKGSINISIVDLINVQGIPVEPGGWSQFQIIIRRNNAGLWKIFW